MFDIAVAVKLSYGSELPFNVRLQCGHYSAYPSLAILN